MDGRDYCRALSERLAVLIAEADDPREAMDEIADAAARGGLIDSSTLPRRESPTAFVMDLFLENPLASDWVNCRLNRIKEPLAIVGIDEAAGHLF